MSLKNVTGTIGNTLYKQVGRASSQIQEQRSLPVDLLEGSDEYLLVFDAPGVEKEDVQVRYLDGKIKIQIDRFREYREGFEMRFPGRGMALDGEFELPANAVVDPDAGMAKLGDNGTLTIEIPKESATEFDDETERIPIDD